jgi:hypothetical protein
MMPETTYPNYSTQFLSSPIQRDMPVSAQINQIKQDDLNNRAPKITPHPLDQSTQLLGYMYECLMDFKLMVKKCEMEPSIKPHQLKRLNQIIDNMGKQILMDIPEEVDKIMM